MRIGIVCTHLIAVVAACAVLAVSAATTWPRPSAATYGTLSLRPVADESGNRPHDDHAHEHGGLRASTAPAAASTCDKDIDTTSTIGGMTFVAAQDNNICTNGDIDLYWLGGQLYAVQAGGTEAAFTISRINSDGTPALVAQRFWAQPNTNTADVMPFKQGGRQYLSLALEAYAAGAACGVTIIDVTDAPDITDADTIAQVTGAGWCSVHNNFVESIDGEGRYVYLTANAASDMRVLDIGNLSSISEVGRYTHPEAGGAGVWVHDVTVVDHGGSIGRRAYVAYWDAGLMILDADDVTPGVVDAGSVKQPLNPNHSIDPSTALHIHHAFPTMDGLRVFIQDEFASIATNQTLDGDEPIQMWDITNPATPVYVDGIDLGSPLQPLVNPPHNMEIRYDLDVDGDGLPDRDRLYVGWYRGGFQAFDFALAGFTARPLYHQVQTEAADGSWDGAWAVRVERIGGTIYTFQSDRRYGLIVGRVGVGAPMPDSDGDGLDDAVDNCPGAANADQLNSDGNFIDLSPPKAFDDTTLARSDALGDACDADDDNDGRSDAEEIAGTGCASAVTDPLDSDSDGDNYLDGAECVIGTNPVAGAAGLASKPTNALCGANTDADGDKLLAFREVCFFNTDPGNANTDGDACSDGREVGSINGDAAVNVVDLQQIASEIGAYTRPGSPAKVNFDITKDGNINVVDLQQAAAQIGSCP